MTDSDFCCLCASDEGVFLDVFTSSHRQLGNRSFVNEFEACLSLKVDRDDALTTKICHRCAIELGQCYQFIENYKKTHNALAKQKKNEAKKSCCFCLTKGTNNYLFALAKDFRSSIHPLQKIYECFDRRITREEAEFRLICLSCRYNLDLLYDLKKLAGEVETKLQRIAESKAILANLPKTETFVVNRKTTLICQSKLELQDQSDSDSEEETMARKKSRSKRAAKSSSVRASAAKLRTCGQCQSSIEGGVDMYRLHSTGVTVCKMCWITMDPLSNNRTNKRRRQSQGDVKNTRLCAVFLKDVLTDPPSSKEKKATPKVEKTAEEGPIYVISDDSDDDDEPLIQALKRTRTRLNSKVESSDKERTLIAKRSLKMEESDGGSKKKLKSVKNETTSSGLRRSARYQSSDSDTLRDNSKAGKAAKPSKPARDNSRNKIVGRKSKSEKNGGDDRSSSNSDVGRTLRKVRKKVPLILKPKSVRNSSRARKNVREREQRTTHVMRKSRTVSKRLTIDSIERSSQPSSKAKNSPKRSKTLMTVRFPFKIRNPYRCKICRTEYRNKIIGMKHELTHYKQVEIKIKKLNVTHHFQTNDQNSNDDTTCSINEKPTATQIEETTTDKEIEDEESFQPSDKPESPHQGDKSEDAQVPDVASSTNGLPVEESTSDPARETADNVSAELDTEKKIDSVTEEHNVESNGTAGEKVEEKIKETDDVEKTVNGKNDTEEKVSAGKTADREKESGEELESDTDIRIVDSGSSGEDSNQQSEKVANDDKNIENVSAPKEAEADDKSETLTNDDKAEEDASKIDTVNAEDESLKNGEREVEEEEENAEAVTPVVTEILQEVMDLATAEVQKRSDSGIASLPETLENISDEINKAVEDSHSETVEETGDDPAKDKEAESTELDSNPATNTLENYLELGSTEV